MQYSNPMRIASLQPSITITLAALKALADNNEINPTHITQAIHDYQIDPDTPIPTAI